MRPDQEFIDQAHFIEKGPCLNGQSDFLCPSELLFVVVIVAVAAFVVVVVIILAVFVVVI